MIAAGGPAGKTRSTRAGTGTLRPALAGVTGYFFPKPERLDKRDKIARDAAEQTQFERIRAKI